MSVLEFNTLDVVFEGAVTISPPDNGVTGTADARYSPYGDNIFKDRSGSAMTCRCSTSIDVTSRTM